MSRKREFYINRFDGGMSDDLRTSDLSKCALVSHFDIYCDPHRLIPLPGFVSDEAISGDSDGLKDYNIKAFLYNGTMYAVGTKSDGTDSKLWQKAGPETAEWTATTNGEGTYDISEYTFISDGNGVEFVTTNGGTTYLSQWTGGGVTDNYHTLKSGSVTQKLVTELSFADNVYATNDQSEIVQIAGSVTDPAKDTALTVSDIQTGDEQVGLFGYRFHPSFAQLLLWDSGSTLADQSIEFGPGRGRVLGYPSGVWIGVVDENMTIQGSEFDEVSNDSHAMAVKTPNGRGGASSIYRKYAQTDTNGIIMPTRAYYRDSMLWYARIPEDATPTTYTEGIYACGRCKPDSPLAVSILMDTSSLGEVISMYGTGQHYFFAHSDDGSVSRLDAPGGTYDVTAVYESLFVGHDSPYLKTLNGIGVTTEDLPSGASVVVKYRTDENDSWTTMGTSDTDGDERHYFTKAEGSVIGGFTEIQFRVEITGKAPIKHIHIDITETDNLPY